MRWENWGSDIARNYFLRTEQEICVLSGEFKHFFCFSCLFFISGSSMGFESKSEHRLFCCSLAEQLSSSVSYGGEHSKNCPWHVGGEVWWFWRLVFKSCQSRCRRAEIHGCYCLLWQISHSLLETSQWNCFPFTWGDKMLFFPLLLRQAKLGWMCKEARRKWMLC